jgi:hypothetical protein
VGRWRLGPRLADAPKVITELGRDVVEGQGQAGWQRTCNASEFLEDLRVYDGIMAADPTVLGGCAFQVGSNDDDWDPFDMSSVWSQVVAEYSGAAPAWTAPLPPKEEPVNGTIVRLWRRSLNRVDRIPLEEYLRGVVPSEMPASWPLEALRAQAIAARTYTLRAIAAPRHVARGADLCDTAQCQAYGAMAYARSDQAVRETARETWSDGPCEYVAKCGRVDCVYCRGQDGTNGQVWSDRMCQWGAMRMAEAGATYRDILAHYYGGDAVNAQLEAAIGAEAQKYIIPLNPNAAFEKAGSSMGLLPASQEYDVTMDGQSYRAQAYRSPGERQWQYIVYCRVGDWSMLRWLKRQN